MPSGTSSSNKDQAPPVSRDSQSILSGIPRTLSASLSPALTITAGIVQCSFSWCRNNSRNCAANHALGFRSGPSTGSGEALRGLLEDVLAEARCSGDALELGAH